MRERRGADVGSLRIDGPVEGLGDVMAHRRQPFDPTFRKALVAELELQVRDHGREVRVAGPLAEAVERALHVSGAGFDRRHRVGHGAPGVVVAVDADDRVVADVGLDVGDDAAHLARQGAAVGVAQHEVRGAVDHGGLDRPQRELGVRLVPVEEVLEVDEHHATFTAQVPHRVGDHRRTFVEGRLERFDDLVLGALRNDADRRRPGFDQVAQGGVVVDLAAGTTGGAECDQRRRRELQFGTGPLEELDVLRVGSGPAALDEVHAEQVELFGDPELVVDRRGDALDLEAVAERRVEHLDVSPGAGLPVTVVLAAVAHGNAPEK